MHLMKNAEILIGCSGYYYSAWKGKFYPAGLKPAEWLSYYSSVFNSVELNGTFYRVPRVSSLKKYADRTGSEFRFSVKMHRYITHIKRLRDCDDEIEDFISVAQEGLGNKLATVLFQMPPS